MQDPIGAFDEARLNFLKYVQTAFGTRYKEIEDQRAKLINKPGVFYQEPWIEQMPRYEAANKVSELTLENLGLPIEGENGYDSNWLKDFASFTQCGLVGDFPLHAHQEEMLKKGLQGKNLVVTAGTGSGKTESFLLPIVAQLVRESKSWKDPEPRITNQDDWWKNPKITTNKKGEETKIYTRIQQRVNESNDRPKAVRALILYPMNALVEDQVSRLRKALDSKESRKWLDENREKNRFFIGRYNGQTPVSGKENPGQAGRLNELAEQLNELEKAQKAAREYDKVHGDEGEDVRFFFPSVDAETAEMRCRWDMQDAPPDILVTNFSMLSIMLMREQDKKIFEQTKKWLEKDDAVFNLVFDELHLYRGTAGTEVAYLVRLLLNRLGLEPSSKKLRILCSSASLDQGGNESDEGKQFLREFFGLTENEKDRYLEVVSGKEVKPKDDTEKNLPSDCFAKLADDWNNIEKNNVEESYRSIVEALEGDTGVNNIEHELIRVLNEDSLITGKVSRACWDETTGIRKTVSIEEFGRKLFGDEVDAETLRKAVRGFLIARARSEFCEIDGKRWWPLNKEELPSFRLHWFFKNVQGLWASVLPEKNSNLPIGELHSSAKIQDSNHIRVLELLYCEQCGEVFLGGCKTEMPNNQGWSLSPVDPNLERAPGHGVNLLSHQAMYPEYGIFWPSSSNDPQNNGANVPGLNDGLTANWIPARLDARSGRVERNHSKSEQNDWIQGYFLVLQHRNNQNAQIINRANAFPSFCPCCGEDYAQRLKDSPIRTFRTGFTKTSQIMAKELFYQLPSKARNDRKLVVFSDSRDDAATLSNDMERYHYLELVRDILYNQITVHGLGKALALQALVADIDNPKLDQTCASYWKQASDDDKKRLQKYARALRIPEVKVTEILEDDPDSHIPESRRLGNEILNSHATALVPLKPFTGIRDGQLFLQLLLLGVNPAGLEKRVNSYKNGNESAPWTELFQYGEQSTPTPRNPMGNDAETFFGHPFLPKISQEVSAGLFGRLYFGFESSGLGFPCLGLTPIDYNDLAKNIGGTMNAERFAQVCHSVIRLLGETYRYLQPVPRFGNGPDPKYNFNEFAAAGRVRAFVNKVSEVANCDTDNLYNALTEAINDKACHTNWLLKVEFLSMKVTGEDELTYKCKNCGCLHLHASAGVCTNCRFLLEKEPNGPKAKEVRADHYYVHHDGDRRVPIRLHCEELTGQTDNQAERQRWFRNIVMDTDGTPPLVAETDVLCVTTTLEVGVDIGDLRAVLQANMPPERYNYQQRAGRGGRRGQSSSVVLTLCRNRSHDEIHFQNPEHITNDPPPIPFLAMSHLELARRLATKEILRRAYIDKKLNTDDGSDVHGEFGPKTEWPNCKYKIQKWIEKNDVVIQDISSIVTRGGQVEPGDVARYVLEDLVKAIDDAVGDPELVAESLAETLAEGAILPMYGMPTRVRLFYHGFDGRRGKMKKIDRALDNSISEFAPGAAKTKDKEVHESIGFCATYLDRQHWKKGYWEPKQLNGGAFTLNMWMALCDACHFLETYDQKGGGQHGVKCPRCGENLREFNARTPAAYRSKFNKGKNAQEGGSAPSSSRVRLAVAGPVVVSSVQNATLEFSGEAKVYSLNDNLKNGFSGATVWDGNDYKGQWLSEQAIKKLNINDTQHDKLESIALAAQRTTDLLSIFPSVVPKGMQLDPLSSGAGVKSAFASAAFLLRAVATDYLDVDPEEIDICHLGRRETQSGKHAGEIRFADFHPNGSGFTRWVNSHIGSCIKEGIGAQQKSGGFVSRMLSDTHIKECQQACYSCLKNFRNMGYHSIFDWRLGMNILRIIHNENHQCGLDGDFDSYDDLKGWPGTAINECETFKTAFNTEELPVKITRYGQLPAIEVNGKTALVVHTLWDTENPTGILADAVEKAKEELGGSWLLFVDVFNLTRRPSWVMSRLAHGKEILGQVPPSQIQLAQAHPPQPTPNPVKAIPAEKEFELQSTPPRGLPSDSVANFCLLDKDAQLQNAKRYLVKLTDGEFGVGTVMLIGTAYHFTPSNSQHGLTQQKIKREQVVAEHV